MNVIKTKFVDPRAQSDFGKALAAKALANKDENKAGLKAIATSRSDAYRVNPYDLTIEDGWNSREMASPENQAHIDELARSIAVHGVLEALTITSKDKQLVIIDGHSRLLATFRAIDVYGAKIESVPVQMQAKGSNEADRLLQQIVRNSGKRLTAYEEGKVYKRLIGYGWTVDKIAEQAARSITHVNNLLELQGAPEAVKDMVIKGEVSPTLAIAQIAEHKGDETKLTHTLTKAVEKAKSEGKNKVTAKNLKTTKKLTKDERNVKVVLEAAKIDNSDTKYITIKMTYAQFDIIQQALDLEV